jgi:HEAT repeat protein
LNAAARDDDMDVRLAALRALARIGDPRAIDGLIGVLREGYYETTLEAAKALASIGEPAVLPLLAALHSMRKIGLRDAILALEWLGDPRALPALEALFGDAEVIEEIHTSAGIVQENLAMRACETIKKKL